MQNLIVLIIWLLGAALLGFILSSVFSGALKFPRDLYLLIYIPFVAIFSILFFRTGGIDLRQLITKNIPWTVLAALLVGALVLRNVFMQPASSRSTGFRFLLDLVWPGLLYGIADAVLLTVVPVLTVHYAYQLIFLEPQWLQAILFGFTALLASLFVTAMYHLGYKEYRGRGMIGPLIGNGILSLAFILTLNPLAVIVPHAAMHIAAMIHGKDTTGQVPPHYT